MRGEKREEDSKTWQGKGHQINNLLFSHTWVCLLVVHDKIKMPCLEAKEAKEREAHSVQKQKERGRQNMQKEKSNKSGVRIGIKENSE